ncbi:MAG: hypothetical protein IT236_12250 [Bacteroidia bacterium]|nr:hypothetical protein [Bacteroidia bacterium]
MNTNSTSKNKTQATIISLVALALSLAIVAIAWMRENGFLPILLGALGAVLAIFNLMKLRKTEPKITMSFMALVFALAAASAFAMEMGTKQEKTNVEEVKAVMPVELKDSVVLQQEEESALDKLNSITDTTSSK